MRGQDWKHFLVIASSNTKRLYLKKRPPAIADSYI